MKEAGGRREMGGREGGGSEGAREREIRRAKRWYKTAAKESRERGREVGAGIQG